METSQRYFTDHSTPPKLWRRRIHTGRDRLFLERWVSKRELREGQYRSNCYSLKQWAGIVLLSPLLLFAPQVANAEPSVRLDLAPRPATCSADFQGLIQQMLPILPSYANRVYTRSDLPRRYMVVAGQPNFEPLPLKVSPEQAVLASDPQQVFFTTLTRRYRDQTIESSQEYHWLFLTQSVTGWRFSMLYSILGSYPQTTSPPPPRDSSEGALATAIRDWLRDCRTTR